MSSHLFTYAIGDIYGDHALLTALLDRIHDHADGEDYRLVFLGNTIDHGPNGNAVLSALRSMELRAPDRVVTLRGWHEALMAEARGDAEAFETWMRNGGEATLRSFGVRRHAELPREVVDWIARRPAEFRDGLRRFVSAATTADEQQDASTVGLHVVHGSSGARAPGQENRPVQAIGRTDIDTGAGFGGCLTAAVFSDLQASPAGFFQALLDGKVRFVAPERATAQPWDPRLALRIADGEPETAAAWSLRQDADLVAARIAQKRREDRRRSALVAAAGLVVVVGGTGILLRPAMTYMARSMAPVETGQQVASAPQAAPEPAVTGPAPSGPATALPAVPERAIPAGETAAAASEPAPSAAVAANAEPEPLAAAPAAPDAGQDQALRTHALPPPGADADALASREPATTAATSPAPEPPSTPAIAALASPPSAPATPVPALPPDSPAPGSPAAGATAPAADLAPTAGLAPSAGLAPPPGGPAIGETAPAPAAAAAGTPGTGEDTAAAERPMLPALAMADGFSGGGKISSDGTGPDFVLPRIPPETRGLSAFALALEPSRRVGWSAAGSSVGDRSLARLGLSREASMGPPGLGSGPLLEDAPPTPAKAAVPQARAKPKPRPKPKVATVPRPAQRTQPSPAVDAGDAFQQGGPIDLRALMDAPQAHVRPRKRAAPRAAAEPAVGPDGVGQP